MLSPEPTHTPSPPRMPSEPASPATPPRCFDWSLICPDLPDVVETQGAHLEPPAPTPMYSVMVDPAFHRKLCERLANVRSLQAWRCQKYGQDAAEEHSMGRTPTELVEKRAAELERLLEALADPCPSPPSDNSPPAKKRRPLRKHRDGAQPRQAQPLATPSPSDVDGNGALASGDASPAAPRRRKRWLSGESVNPALESGPCKTRRLEEAAEHG
ncbi:hypothetical protein BT67DRAFT_52361 [Trichocladium antarcticum]|uniref:Uncharacterized protein n=1 Tax=Trichocladium antarcticum TaxID=1450529 RepID=A0AAN6UIJ3_9PEZI|nr:hypothetical protein BT67DRAFT_52361 [Trichocladium antarcticum]